MAMAYSYLKIRGDAVIKLLQKLDYFSGKSDKKLLPWHALHPLLTALRGNHIGV